MPAYRFKCKKCGNTEEVFFRDGRPERLQCKCGSRDLEKISASFSWKLGEVARKKDGQVV